MTGLYALAERFVGEVLERPGAAHHPFILWCHESVAGGFNTDEVPWCSSFLNRLAWLERLPRSKSAAARSWLTVGVPIPWASVQLGDVVILKRGKGPQPNASVIQAPGHVCLYAGQATSGELFMGLGGNQNNQVSIAPHKFLDVLGVRRLEG